MVFSMFLSDQCSWLSMFVDTKQNSCGDVITLVVSLININQIRAYTFWGCIFLGKGYPSLRWLKKRCHTILIFSYMYRNATHTLAAVSIVKFSIRFVWLQTKFPWKILISRSRDCQKPSDWNQLRTSPVFSNI